MVANISFWPPPNYSIEIHELPETDDEANVQKSVQKKICEDNEIASNSCSKVPYPADLSHRILPGKVNTKRNEEKRYGTAVLSIHPAQYIPSRSVTSRLDGVIRQEMGVKHFYLVGKNAYKIGIMFWCFTDIFIFCS